MSSRPLAPKLGAGIYPGNQRHLRSGSLMSHSGKCLRTSHAPSRRLCAAVVGLSAVFWTMALRAQPFVGPVIETDAPVPMGTVAGDLQDFSVAGDGTDLMVAYVVELENHGDQNALFDIIPSAVRVARVDASGNGLDPNGL